MASHGFVVVAIEHRDGSGLGSYVWTGVDSVLNSSGAKMSAKRRHNLREAFLRGASESVVELALNKNDELNQKGGDESEKPALDPLRDYSKVPYLPFENVGLAPFTAEQGEKEMALRRAQLAMRAAEIQEAMYIMKRINAGDSEWLASKHTRSLGSALCGPDRFIRARKRLGIEHCDEFFSHWKGKLDIQFPTLAGHSFGGATVFEFLRREQSDFQYGIILDPWMDPVRDPQTDESVRKKLTKPVYVINSEGFTMWREQYNKLIRVLIDGIISNPAHRGWLMTLCGSNHGDFSDLPFLLPRIFGSELTARESMTTFTKVVMNQIKLLREQKHLFDVRDGLIADDLGVYKDLVKVGGLHLNSDPDAPRVSKRLLYRIQAKIVKARLHRGETKSLFWELKGWKKEAEQDPKTRAYRKHQRVIAHEIKREARAERARNRARRGSVGVSEAGSENLAEIEQRLWEIETDQGSGDENDEEGAVDPVYIDPLDDNNHEDENIWDGTMLDSDARMVYEDWHAKVHVHRHNRRPHSLLTFALWYLGIRKGLATAGHLLVHTM